MNTTHIAMEHDRDNARAGLVQSMISKGGLMLDDMDRPFAPDSTISPHCANGLSVEVACETYGEICITPSLDNDGKEIGDFYNPTHILTGRGVPSCAMPIKQARAFATIARSFNWTLDKQNKPLTETRLQCALLLTLVANQ